MSRNVWVYTMNQGSNRGRWSRYIFPWTIQAYAHLRDDLFLREGDTVHKVVEHHLYDDGAPFLSMIQWQWLDFEQPGQNKMMIGFDIVGEGEPTIQIGYDQTNLDAFTTEYAIPADTYPGQIIPFPLNAPTFCVRLNYQSDEDWEWEALTVYLDDFRMTS